MGSFLLISPPKAAKVREDFKFEVRPEAGWISSIRLEALPHAKHGGSIVRGNGQSAMVQLSAALRGDKKKETPLAIAEGRSRPEG